jgi:hypothetical protein
LTFFLDSPGAVRPSASGFCPNCNARLASHFCASCGQESRLHVASAGEFLHEFVGHYVAFEGKLWKSLALLLFKPGKLTAEYIEGRRARYVQPLRIYLTLSILFFALLGGMYKFGGFERVHWYTAKLVTISAPPPGMAGEPKKLTIRSDLTKLNPAWGKNLDHLNELSKADQAKLAVKGFLSYAPYAMFIMLPVFALYLKLLYLGSGRVYGEHLLFSLHANGYAFLVLGIMLGLLLVLPVEPVLLLLAPLLLYLPLAMRRVYGGTWLGTGARWLLLITVHLVTLVMLCAMAVLTSILSQG